MNTTVLTVILLFMIGFVSDLVLQQLGPHYPRINLFAPFWDRYGALGAATIAGLITLLFGGLFLLFAWGVYKYFGMNIKSWSFVLFSTALAFALGVKLDILTNHNNWLGQPLRKWYDTMGMTDAALWSGGITFGFTALIVSTFLKYR